MNTRRFASTLALCTLAASAPGASAAVFVQGGSLTGTLAFMVDASTGGTDATQNEPGQFTPQRFFDFDNDAGNGATDPSGAGTISIESFAFATSAQAAPNDADTLTLTFVYLGADETNGGTDDVTIGTVAVGYTHSGAGVYATTFDAPLTASIDGLGNRFRIFIAPSNAAGTGSVRLKQASTGGLAFESGGGIKISVGGDFTPIPEPSAALLGLSGLALLLRRRR